MRCRFFQIVLPFLMALVLSGCGFADIRSPVPDFMRRPEADPLPPEPPPDVRRLVHDNLDAVFVANSNPRDVQVSAPHHEARGSNWTACVRAEITSAFGKPIGTQTWRISISAGQIVDRRRVDADDTCETESYTPI
jgi:hypothetical protein